ncbi:unnamed protein product [Ilex paraguariensis]|uniref:RBR-type E3 ubiquitin transferase n=1 Tax=Ilex paraguariensis TaxID=185542 RepID=A0ABC8RPB4_9AQUA
MAQESSFDRLCVDDFYFSALMSENNEDDQIVLRDDQINPISDSKYAEELQFQEAIMASLISSQNSNNSSSNSLVPSSSSTILPIAMANPEPMGVAKEVCESSQSFCEICAERKESDDMFRIDKCSHSFCTDCISKHVVCKIQDNIKTVNCPGFDCKSVLELDNCRSMIPNDALVRWDEVICESLILASQKFYCPFKDCSGLLVNDTDEVIRESECPICRRLFCAQCYVPWHSGIECEEYQRLNEDERGREDLLMRELAREKNWMRCPYCKFYVEKTEGCLHMVCRCKFQFCYACGGKWSDTHSGCQGQ